MPPLTPTRRLQFPQDPSLLLSMRSVSARTPPPHHPNTHTAIRVVRSYTHMCRACAAHELLWLPTAAFQLGKFHQGVASTLTALTSTNAQDYVKVCVLHRAPLRR